MKKAIAIIIALFILTSCSSNKIIKTLSGYTQGTTWQISYWDTDKIDSLKLREAIEKELTRLDSVLSNYRNDSTIEKFNADRTLTFKNVGQEIVHLVQIADEVSRATNGCYDLTIRPLFDLWGFSDHDFSSPKEADIQTALKQVGFENIMTSPNGLLRKSKKSIEIDLSSIAQGYSVSRLSHIVESFGIRNYLVEIGGELQARGSKPYGQHWRIGIERPLPEGRVLQRALTLQKEAALAVMTSGTYRHYFDENGIRYSHVIDARNGRPVTHNTLSVTVVDSNPVYADAWSTALLCLGAQEGNKVADRAGVAAMFITDKGNQLVEITSTAWRAMNNVIVQ